MGPQIAKGSVQSFKGENLIECKETALHRLAVNC